MWFTTDQAIPKEDLNPEMLGGKGYGLAWMTANGINVPPAIIIPTSMCVKYMGSPKTTMKEVGKELPKMLMFFMEKFGYMPLLSVRSGARVSMPGMMDTVLNVGLDGNTLDMWKEKLGEACATDCMARLHQMYGDVVLGNPDTFVLPLAKDQILNSIEAVFKSWNNERAKEFRKLNDIPDEWGTAVVLQAMVFGNMGKTSGTGVLFTRNTDTGAAGVTGEFLEDAQGEDVVAGVRTPLPFHKMVEWNAEVYMELLKVAIDMEKLKKDVQDIEFTVQEGKLYILQTRNAMRTPRAALKIAHDMYIEGLLTRTEALKRVKASQYDQATQPVLDPKFKDAPFCEGIPGCSGVVTGKVVHSSEDAVKAKENGENVVLVTKETTPDDIKGMVAAVGIITMEGGSTSHAAVVARGMNKPCVVGVGKDLNDFKAGSVVSFDGATGRIWQKEVPIVAPDVDQTVAQFTTLLYENNVVPFDGVNKSKAALNGNPYLAHPDKLVQLIAGLLSSADEVFVELSGQDDEAVNEFLNIFVPSNTYKNVLAKVLLDVEIPEGKKLTIFTQEKMKENLNLPKGVTVVPVATSQDELILGEDVVWMGKQTKAIKRLIELKAAAKESVTVIGGYVKGKECFETKSSAIARLLS
jgi:pyruvate,orthophosphate dikinase